ncbi:hypothetical protein BLTE_28990 [Blastochloris tepida]|uniref:Uncharacterized protein n=1 Tax=Blastochloris tepida TaxID=2233851 RepID=A0A348G3T1_9HYPH|nr:hypothetical protein BLTE_28990 [Blastochloris tepida]
MDDDLYLTTGDFQRLVEFRQLQALESGDVQPLHEALADAIHFAWSSMQVKFGLARLPTSVEDRGEDPR